MADVTDYYTERLSGTRLERCYQIAPPDVQAYLRAEIEFVCRRLRSHHVVLELGCGYGRVMVQLAPHVRTCWGIDTSWPSLRLARERLAEAGNCRLAAMNAVALAFADASFDVVICIQNGISAFGTDPHELVREARRVTRTGGRILLSSYAETFWPARLRWFEHQAGEGLVGPIDRDATGDGVIVCRDGFRATTFRESDFRQLAADHGLTCDVTEVAASSLFCELF